jgi:UDP-N-acetylglucosamine 2-epimerase (non-hydrolysing)
LLKEGKEKEKIHFVGNTMLDTIVNFEDKIDRSTIKDSIGVTGDFALVTFHRPSNVDDKEGLAKIIDILNHIAKQMSVVFVLHPRTIKNLESYGMRGEIDRDKNIYSAQPLGYFDFQKLIKEASFILTDSGGIQEEATFRKTPCLTFRENTERPITCEIGSNTLVGTDFEKVKKAIDDIFNGKHKKSKIPELWDGNSTGRIVEILLKDSSTDKK